MLVAGICYIHKFGVYSGFRDTKNKLGISCLSRSLESLVKYFESDLGKNSEAASSKYIHIMLPSTHLKCSNFLDLLQILM